jgi:hypothetical protein
MSDVQPQNGDGGEVAVPEAELKEELVTPRRVLSPAFWIVIALGLACVLGGLAIALLGPRLYPPAKPDAPIVAPR